MRGPLLLVTVATVVIAALVAGMAWSFASASTAAGVSSGTTWYVDCSAPHNGAGTLSRPFDTLEPANHLTLHAGDQLLFRRGASCTGMLAPRGGGSPKDPVVIGAYGSGKARPEIDGQGQVNAPVWLADMPHVTVQGLELTNAGDSAHLHRGLYFTSQAAPVSGVTVRNLLVDHVDSLDTFTGGKTSGGIVGQALGAEGRFSNIDIEHNVVRDASRQGITVYGTASSSRPPATQPWPQASTRVVIQGNTVERVQGDGIVPLGTNRAVVEHNVVRQGNLAGYDFASQDRNCAAGIWAWDANNTVVQYNDVSDMHYGPSTTPGSLNGCDGEAFDVDGNQDGTVIQYNYSHDNAGGFLLLCVSGGTAASPNPDHRADVRFNLSVDDNATFSPTPCSGDFNPAVNNLDGIQLYNNTIVAPTPRVAFELGSPLTSYFGALVFTNNVVDATSPTAATYPFPCGTACSHNLFFGLPAPPTATSSVTSNPRFVDPVQRGTDPAAAGFKLLKSSPAIGAGIAVSAGVAPPAAHDFFGTTVTKPSTIGFAQN